MGYPQTTLTVDLPCIMGIVNVTPDSFSDGGRFAPEAAPSLTGCRLVEEGAAIVDVGGESTRPGSAPVATGDEELAASCRSSRACARHRSGSRSRSTRPRPRSRGAALAAGATIVNDVTALRGDPGMVAVVAEAGCPVCLMHMLGEPRTMQDDPRYGDVVAEVSAFLGSDSRRRRARAMRRGAVLLDPGIGFGKTLEHNLALLAALDRIAALGRPVVLGASRKRFLGASSGARAGRPACRRDRRDDRARG